MTERGFTTIENTWIHLADGTRLAARIWMPEGAEADPVPAVFEFLPYRKGDGTCLRDESTYPVFAASGIAGVRVDIRGSGESDGVIDGEYTPLELANACELIAWIAAQPWCNGHVGMMGISWGGFNCLQVAALRPPALKAIISIASTVDRYNDDIHYKNGTHLSAQLSWAATMLGYQSRSPDPAVVGEGWREMWMERLENLPFFMQDWLPHQRRDAFWKHGSISEDFSAVEIPVLVIAGWADGYRNTPLKLVEGLGDKARALIGPWVHKYPHFAWPKPRADFLGEAIAWWKNWLAGEKTGVEDWPQVRAYIQDACRPLRRREFDPGRWIAKDRWSEPLRLPYHVGTAGGLHAGQATANQPHLVTLASPLATGTQSGEYFTLKPDAEMAGDQRLDDAGSLTFDTPVLESDLDLLGQPVLVLRLSSATPLANLCARLVDVHPDGTATRITFGVLNLAHRDSNEAPQAMPVGEMVEIRLTLDACGYRLRAGHRLRLALSSAYWPMILPPPLPVSLTLDRASLTLHLPALGDHRDIAVKEPDNPDPLPKYATLIPSKTERSVSRDLMSGETIYRIFEDTGMAVHPVSGLAARQIREEHWRIGDSDPLSMQGTAGWITEMQRDGLVLRTASKATLRATESEWITEAEVTAEENGRQIFEKHYSFRAPRDFM